MDVVALESVAAALDLDDDEVATLRGELESRGVTIAGADDRAIAARRAIVSRSCASTPSPLRRRTR